MITIYPQLMPIKLNKNLKIEFSYVIIECKMHKKNHVCNPSYNHFPVLFLLQCNPTLVGAALAGLWDLTRRLTWGAPRANLNETASSRANIAWTT